MEENATQDKLSFILGDDYLEEASPLSFNAKVPIPQELVKTTAPCATDARLQKLYGASNWYDWQVKNWGTKWDLSHDTYVEKVNANTLHYSFDSAWSPPCAWVEKVAAMYPKLHFLLHYEEPGMCFRGDFICDNGVAIQDFCEEYDPTKESDEE